MFSDNILAITLQSKIRNCLLISGEKMWLQGDDLPEVTLWVGNEVRTLNTQRSSTEISWTLRPVSPSERFKKVLPTEAYRTCTLGSDFFSQHKFREINDPKNSSFVPLFCCTASCGMDRHCLQQRASEFLTVVCGGS